MSIVEGVGDEIIQFLGVLFVLILGIVAWLSTRISDLPQIRTIVIVERRSENEVNQQSSQPDRTSTVRLERNLCENHIPNESTPIDASDKNKSTTQSGDFNVSSLPTPDIQGTSENIVSEQESSSNSDVPTNDRNASEVTNDQEVERTEAASNESSADNIRIRLKYLNDDQKLVEGRLQEHLGDFKRRHFSVELSRQKKIRLIFNGQVLQSDEQTLQGYGLYDNCVVHCLIHAQQNTNNRTNSQSHTNTSPPDWNLGFLLYASISIVLGFAWFFRYHYSHLFTLTTTAALVSLTGMFAVSLFGMYISDEDAVPS